MQIVIDIPEVVIEAINFKKNNGKLMKPAEIVILNGTPLPKGHGDLIDRQKLIEFADSDYEDGEYHAVSISEIKYAKAIIKADKG